MSIDWKGVLPAITTKFDSNDELDLDLFAHNLATQVDAGVEGIILGGTLGEASTLSETEKEKLVKFSIAKLNGAVPVIINIAEGATREAVRQAQLAESWGAEGLMLLPPMRYKTDHRETVTYFKTVAAATDLPIILYNNPVDYKTEITLAMLDELSEIDKFQAIKESSRDVTNVTRLFNRFSERYKIMCGVDTLSLEELLLGAHGLVAGLVCAFPHETVALYKLAKAGRLQEAVSIYRWFMPLLELDIHTKLVQYIKMAETQAGIGSEYVRAPRLTLVGREREQVLNIVDTAIATRPALPDYHHLSEKALAY